MIQISTTIPDPTPANDKIPTPSQTIGQITENIVADEARNIDAEQISCHGLEVEAAFLCEECRYPRPGAPIGNQA